MDLLHLVAEKFGKDLSPGRMFESMVLLSIIWSKVKPHLKKIEARLLGLELALNHEDARFKKVEGRVTVLENVLKLKKGDAK